MRRPFFLKVLGVNGQNLKIVKVMEIMIEIFNVHTLKIPYYISIYVGIVISIN